MQTEGDSSVKEMMQKVAAKLEDKWDINKNSSFNEKWDVSSNDIVSKLEDKWNAHKKKKLVDQPAPVGDGVAAKSGGAADFSQIKERRNADKDKNIAENQAPRVFKSSDTARESSNRTCGSPTADNPYVLRPVPCSESGLED